MIKIAEQNINTYDFFVQTKRDRFFKLHDEEIERLIDIDGNIKHEVAEPVYNCPVCGCREYKFLFKKQGFAFKQCVNLEQCGHIYVDPQISEEALVGAYTGDGTSASDLWMDVMLSDANQQYDREKYLRGIDAIEQYSEVRNGGRSRRVLDIGCSIGLFLAVARDRGWEGVGLELNERAVCYARDTLDLDVKKQLLQDADFEAESFDAVTLWGVIEHLKEPVATIRQAVRLLKPGGIFLTFCPNAASLVCKVIREYATAFDGHDHPQNFTPQSIRLAMNLADLEMVHISFHQPDIDTVFNYIEGRHPYVKQGWNSQSVLMQAISGQIRSKIEELLLDSGLGYKMMTVNRKPLG